MRTYFLLVFASLLVCLVTGCASQQPAAQPANAQPEYVLTATIKDLMDSVVDPSADFIWESVSATVDAKGLTEKQPRTDEEWQEVRRRAIALLEATNLLKIPGRHVAKPGQKADDPKVELPPEKIEELINADRAAFNKFAQGLHDATMPALKAIDAKDPEELLNSGDDIDAACEKCHLKYWYPDEVQQANDAKK